MALPATHEQLGAQEIGLGPTVAVIHTVGPVVYGILVEQVWLLGGGTYAYLQPQVAWTLNQAGTTVRARSESTYQWNEPQWTVPVIVDVAQIAELVDQTFGVSFGPIGYVDRAEDSPRWGFRATITLVSR